MAGSPQEFTKVIEENRNLSAKLRLAGEEIAQLKAELEKVQDSRDKAQVVLAP